MGGGGIKFIFVPDFFLLFLERKKFGWKIFWSEKFISWKTNVENVVL
jgi:hypothetical protein